MITEKELQEAIAECQGVRNPNANTCLKLASYYTILDHVAPNDQKIQAPVIQGYSYDAPVEYDSESEFMRAVKGISEYDRMALFDELMSTLQLMNPRLYKAVIRKTATLK